ncbi:PREDICTED: transcription repressor OFP11-like [Nelumbo nucifera]|uniref:Transcription repressor n=1 Tax=Nelumbo nucifera TaxID=4432 RepID=A0A1U8BJE1_NELNU|nr:PREDICTED: transcription repressor OFP11-like [Nelumbo nucifera]
MSNGLRRNLNLCFLNTKRRRPPTTHSPAIPLASKDQKRPAPTTNPSVLIKNFNSLYDLTSDSTSKSRSRSSDDFSSSDSDLDTTPDFATIFASQRFFFSSPGRSNSIIEPPECPPESDTLVGGGVPIPTYSPDPFMDFRRSMQEMVEARELLDVKADWDYLHELLLCYLTLNPKHTHKFIIGAFADLLVSLMTEPEEGARR